MGFINPQLKEESTMRFCDYPGEKVDEFIESQLEMICTNIIKRIEGIKSIVLSGGFGRGEGSVLVKNGRIYPLNDYDIYIISDKKIPENVLFELQKESSRLIKKGGIPYEFMYNKDYSLEADFYVDLKSVTSKGLKNFPPLIRYYELKYSSMLLYGKDCLDGMPTYSAKDLPLSDGLRFLLNRISNMIMCFEPSFIKKDITMNRRDILMLYSTKAVVETATALTLLSGRFVPTYKERTDVLIKHFKRDFPELYEKIPEYPDILKKYTIQKLRPDFSLNPIESWFEARKYLTEIFKFFVQQYLKIRANNLIESTRLFSRRAGKIYFNDYLKFFIKKKIGIDNFFLIRLSSFMLQNYLNIRFFFILPPEYKVFYFKNLLSFQDPGLKIYTPSLLLLNSIEESGDVNRKYLDEAYGYISKIFLTEYDNDNIKLWSNLKKSYINSWALYSSQKII